MKRKYIALLAFATLFSACKDDEIFEKEMYKNVVALISTNYYNTFEEEVPLTGEEATGYIVASVGGTHTPTKDLVIEVQEDQAPLDAYNWALFDADERLYAKMLPPEKYEIADYKIQINAGERTGRTMVTIRPDGLSPDSTYFIGLKASDVSGVELNPDKNTILYQVLIKNDYASQAQDNFYSMSGMLDSMVTAGNKEMFPLSRTTSRIIAGNESFESNEDDIYKTSITLQVNEGGSVTIKPYGDIQVRQINDDPNYPNTFELQEIFGRKFNVFLLCYEYTIGETTHLMQERLEIQVK